MAINKQYGLDNEELKLSILRLSHFSPSTEDEYGNQMIDYLLLDSLAAFELSLVTATEIKDTIKKNFRLTFEEEEINAAANRLGIKKTIKYFKPERKFGKPKFQLVKKTEEDIANNKAILQDIENKVYKEWKVELLKTYEGQQEVEKNIYKLTNVLQTFITRMFISHGVECVAILYPDSDKTQSWLKNIQGKILESLTTDNKNIDAIISIEIPQFFKSKNESRRQYITNLFNASFLWHLIQVDEQCANLLKQVTKGQKLFLDNNILFSIIGLHGQDALEASNNMLRIADELGYELWITTKTIDEFHNSLNWKMKELRETPPVPASLAKIALEKLGADSFITVYWKNLIEKGITIEEFIAEISYLDDILEGFNIQTSHKFRKDIDNSEELKEEESLLRKACGEYLNKHIIEHDAFHRLFIGKIRKGPKYKFKDAKAWFLTQDQKLPFYSKVARKGQGYLPFCITTNQWMQINRPFLTRTKNVKDYEESFYVLITQPYLRHLLPLLPMDKAYNKILSRLNRYKEMTPELATEIAADSHFMIAVSELEDDEQRMNEMIEEKMVVLNKGLMRVVEELKANNKQKDKRIEKIDEKYDTLFAKFNETNKTFTEQIEKLNVKYVSTDSEKQKLEDENKELRIKNTIAQTAIGKLKEKIKRFVRGAIKWCVFLLLLIGISYFIWFDIFNMIPDEKEAILKFLLFFGSVVALLNIPLHKHWKVWVGIIIGLLAIYIPLIW